MLFRSQMISKSQAFSDQISSLFNTENDFITENLEKDPKKIHKRLEYIKLLEIYPNLQLVIIGEGEEKIDLLYSRSAYGSDKNNMSHEKDKTHIHPCVYTIGKSGEPRLMFSNTKNNGHFDIAKVIWSNGAATVPIVDSTGEYGLTQFSYAIVDKKENLENIKKALENKEFLKLMKKVSFSAHKYNFRVISCFKKDWWKSFV